MKKADQKVYKKTLIELRARLRGDVSTLAKAALTQSAASGGLSNLPSDLADKGSDSYEQDNTLRLMDNEEFVLEMIEGALERIENGTYGTCAECEGRIPKMRLNVVPYTSHCIKCATKLEEEGY